MRHWLEPRLLNVLTLATTVLLVLRGKSADGATTIPSYVVAAGGGATVSTNNTAIHGTIGQPVIATASAATSTILSGFWVSADVPLTGVPPGTSQEALVPTAFRLYPNTPNPVIGATTFVFDVPRRGGHVRLAVHDVAGRLLRTLVDEVSDPGQKRVNWDGRDDAGARARPGVYLYALSAPGYRSERKLVLMQ